MREIFPTLLHEFEDPTFKQKQREFIKCVYEEKKKDPVGVNMTNRGGGWQSRNWRFRSENQGPQGPSLLSEFLIEQIVNYFQKNRILKVGVEVRFANWWININTKGSFNVKHIHGSSHISGVFYLQASQGSGKIVFDSPHIFSRSRENASYSTAIVDSLNYYPAMEFDPVEGMMMMFPSDLLHGVEENKSNKDRISLSFNILVL